MMTKNNKKAPTWLSHKPIVTVDYESRDESVNDAGDAKFLTVGRATWDSSTFSVKVWRKIVDKDRWSRQSEELPMGRLIDLVILLVSIISGEHSRSLEEFVQDKTDCADLKSFLIESAGQLEPRFDELFRLLATNKHNSISVPKWWEKE